MGRSVPSLLINNIINFFFFHQDNAARFCEIIAGYSLSLELSTMSAIASGQFASAHEKLGRNHPVGGFKVDHLNKEFFSAVVGSRNKFLDAVPFKVSQYVLTLVSV